MPKKEWVRPKLTILTREKSEVAVLTVCKNESAAQIGPSQSMFACAYVVGGGYSLCDKVGNS